MIQVVPHLVVHLQKKPGCHLAPALAHAVPGQEEVVAHVLARDEAGVEDGEAAEAGQHQALQDLGAGGCGVDEADVCPLEGGLAVVPPQPANTD